MYTGRIIDDLIAVVARAEEHCGEFRGLEAPSPSPMTSNAYSIFGDESSYQTPPSQPQFSGVA